MDPVPAYTRWRSLTVIEHSHLHWSRRGIVCIRCLVRSRKYTFQLGLTSLCSLYLLETGNPTDDIQGCQCAAGQLGLVWVGAPTQQSSKAISVLVFALVLVWQHVIALGSLGIPLKSVMSAVGQCLCCRAGRKDGRGAYGLPLLDASFSLYYCFWFFTFLPFIFLWGNLLLCFPLLYFYLPFFSYTAPVCCFFQC